MKVKYNTGGLLNFWHFSLFYFSKFNTSFYFLQTKTCDHELISIIMSSKTPKLEFHKNKDGIVSKQKETNKEQWITRVMQVIGKENGEKMSLPILKKKLREEYGLNTNLTRNKYILKKVLSSCVEEKKLEKS